MAAAWAACAAAVSAGEPPAVARAACARAIDAAHDAIGAPAGWAPRPGSARIALRRRQFAQGDVEQAFARQELQQRLRVLLGEV